MQLLKGRQPVCDLGNFLCSCWCCIIAQRSAEGGPRFLECLTDVAGMWLEKLRNGCLQILTETGLYWVKPSFGERLRLMWIFRNFSTLSQQVLSLRQRELIARVCSGARAVSRAAADEAQPDCLIGTLATSVLPRLGHERRNNTRCPVSFEVRYGVGKDLATGEGYDFGGGGLAFTGPKPYAPGTEIELHFRLQPHLKWTKVRVLVRHRDGNRMGVSFLKFAEGEQPKILQVAAQPGVAEPSAVRMQGSPEKAPNS